MSAAPFREPWFLKGRTSVVQRAVVMSLVLGGLSLVAGVLGMIGFFLTMTSPGSNHLASVASCVGGAALALAVAAPYARWQGDSEITVTHRLWTMLAVCLSISVVVELLDSACPQAMADLRARAGRVFHDEARIALALAIICLAWNAAFVRPTRQSLLMVGLSTPSIPAMPLMFQAINLGHAVVVRSMGGSSPAVTVFEIVSILSLPGQCFALLVVPWGIPFWFPPERNPAPFSAAQG